MLEGVTVSESKSQKDELILEGSDVQNVSQSGRHNILDHTAFGLTVIKLRPSKECVGYGTKISENSWMVSTFPRRAQSLRIKSLLYPFLLFFSMSQNISMPYVCHYCIMFSNMTTSWTCTLASLTSILWRSTPSWIMKRTNVINTWHGLHYGMKGIHVLTALRYST